MTAIPAHPPTTADAPRFYARTVHLPVLRACSPCEPPRAELDFDDTPLEQVGGYREAPRPASPSPWWARRAVDWIAVRLSSRTRA